ncbi:hypothetical protein [Streptomyces sp. NPDC001833]|uniref:hypothetical protein n=1 Tax=Streptomyces sp. NPDC001833 TaxID=3154658 RepID=UPI003323CC7E
MARALTGVLGTSHIDLRVPSDITGTTRFYGSAGDLDRDVVDARVWGGVHTRTADVAGCRPAPAWPPGRWTTASSGSRGTAPTRPGRTGQPIRSAATTPAEPRGREA